MQGSSSLQGVGKGSVKSYASDNDKSCTWGAHGVQRPIANVSVAGPVRDC